MSSRPEDRLGRIDTQLDSLHEELWELGYRAIAERVVLPAKRLEVLIREHSSIK